MQEEWRNGAWQVDPCSHSKDMSQKTLPHTSTVLVAGLAQDEPRDGKFERNEELLHRDRRRGEPGIKELHRNQQVDPLGQHFERIPYH